VVYSGRAQCRTGLNQVREGCVSLSKHQYNFVEDQACHAEDEVEVLDREDRNNNPRHHRSTFFSWSPRFAIVFRDAAPHDFTLSLSFAPGRLPNMQGCFALAIMIFAGFIAVPKDLQQAK
jgi:hypothetical protein